MENTYEIRYGLAVRIGVVVAFTIAAATGAFFRFGPAYGISVGLDLTNVRHAHTHLMHFAWVTPALFLLINVRLSQWTERPTPGLSVLSTVAALVLGLVSYLPFLIVGYAPLDLGFAFMPPSVVIAGLNMLAWYGYVVGYRQHTKGIDRPLFISLFDAALLFLVLSTIGAWGISIITPLRLEGILWPTAMTHLFLDYFSEGWLLFGVMGLAAYGIPIPANKQKMVTAALWMLIAGTAVSFLLGMPKSLISAPAQLLARLGGSMMAMGLFAFLLIFWRSATGAWRAPLSFLAIKAVGLFIVSVTPMIWWYELFGERILYIHANLLGFVSLGIFAAFATVWPQSDTGARLWMNRAVMLVVLSLVPLTSFWPSALRGPWMIYAVAWVALGPVIAGVFILFAARRAVPAANRTPPGPFEDAV